MLGPLSEDQRREIFRVLVTAQDMDMSVDESRQMVAEIHGLTADEVIEIEREGLRAGWPPL